MSSVYIVAHKDIDLNWRPIFDLLCDLCFQRQFFYIYFFILLITAGIKDRVAAVKRLLVLHHSADYIFISFGAIQPILITFKILYRLSQC